ncbi:MAG: ABC transporter ATP-binding protein/permease [Clostridia bacterium]|nr:ABC transporter ATP-binding protein/permease [Clostridia bacterium]
MNLNDVLSNRPIPEALQEKLQAEIGQNEKIRFVIVGDLTTEGQYGDCLLAVTESRVLCIESGDTVPFALPLCDISSASVRRLYSNAVLYLNKKAALRASFAVVALMEAVAKGLSDIGEDPTAENLTETVRHLIEKEQCFCPKCGRALIHPGAECLNCISKGRLIKKLSAYLKPQIKPILLSIIISVITVIAELVPPYVTKTLVDNVIPQKNIRLLCGVVAFLLAIYVLQAVIATFRGNLMRLTGAKIIFALRSDVYKKAQYLPVSYYDKTSTGSIYARISNDTNTLNNFMLRVTQEAIVQFLILIGIMIVMFCMNWRLALLSLAPVPVVAIGARFFGKKIKPVYHRIWTRWSSISGLLSDTLPGIRVIKAFAGEKRAIEKFDRYNNNWLKEERRASFLTSLFPQSVNFFITCGTLIIWGLGGSWTIHGVAGMSTGLLVSFLSYAAMFYVPVNFFANLSDSYQQALTSAERLLDILDAEPEADLGKGNAVGTFKGRIEYKNVSFSFDKTDKTLQNINLTIEPGDIVGIVGTTGAGKSTLINLLMRFYDNYEGEILVDGQDIRTIDMESFRSQIGFVQQEPLMFHDTIFNNIALADPDLPVEAVIEAADVSNAHEFIAAMPDGYDTVLGERGTGLSGGERQRISIARAIIKNPSILIFDEATASVDSETEHLIQGAIERLISGRTTLMIAHRLSTLRRANKIVVVDNGQIIECGTPAELMAQKGKYYRLIEIQNMFEEAQRRNEDERFDMGG